MIIFSIYNKKIEFHNRPIYCESSNEAISYVTNVIMNDFERSLFAQKDDLELVALGEIDFVTGVIQPYALPEKIIDLATIFDAIPQERIKAFVTRDEFDAFRKEFKNVGCDS